MEERHYEYATFWQRFAAALIDGVIVGGVVMVIMAFVGGAFMATRGMDMFNNYNEISEPEIIGLVLSWMGLMFSFGIGHWLYYALQESSPRMATIGKRAVGLVVTDLEGERISFARATGRYFGKILSGMFACAGYIMAAFTERKQALHDLLASSLVMQDS